MADRLVFSKSKRACYISHLDLMRTFQRAFNRAGVEIRHTEGFNPHPFVSIAMPLSLGFSSQCEILEFGLVAGATAESLPGQMTAVMPEGIQILRCYQSDIKLKHIIYVDYQVTMSYHQGVPTGAVEAWGEFLKRESHVIQKKSKKARSGVVSLDIMPLIHDHELAVKGNDLSLSVLLTAQNPGLNPSILVGAFAREYPDFAPDFHQCHRKEIYDKERGVFR